MGGFCTKANQVMSKGDEALDIVKQLGDGNKVIVNQCRIENVGENSKGTVPPPVRCTICQDRKDVKKRTSEHNVWQVRKCPGCGNNKFVCKFHCNAKGARRFDNLEWVDGEDKV